MQIIKNRTYPHILWKTPKSVHFIIVDMMYNHGYYQSSVHRMDHKYERGDKVEVIANTALHNRPLGSVFTFLDYFRDEGILVTENTYYYKFADVKKLNDNMEKVKINPLVAANLDADTQALVEAGYLDARLMTTPKGLDALMAILYIANKAQLVTDAQTELAEAAAKTAAKAE